MNNEYTVSEVIEVGKAQELILGGKEIADFDVGGLARPETYSDLDD
jgi:hypothetical protein